MFSLSCDKHKKMRRSLVFLLLLQTLLCHAQAGQKKWLRAFRITDYMVQLNDTTVIVQVHPADGTVLEEKQMGLMRGIWQEQKTDTVEKGYGKLYLIKGDYYYFSISHNHSGSPLRAGDLLYALVPASAECTGLLPGLALHCITLTDVYEQPFFDSLRILQEWPASAESAALDTMLKDIRFTANYFLKNQPAMNVMISNGPYKGEKVLEVMLKADEAELKEFIGYMIARPRIYAGHTWKVSEIYATWLTNGAPRVIR